MSERDGYEPGVPCWVATVHPDPEKAVGFYTELFGWETTNLISPESSSKYYVCKHRGRDVAAIGSERGDAPSGPAWNTYIWAESAEDTVAKVTDVGGRVVIEPFDRLDAARVAVVADPAGAVFGVWQPGEHRGARLVNEPGTAVPTRLSHAEHRPAGSATTAMRAASRRSNGSMTTLPPAPVTFAAASSALATQM